MKELLADHQSSLVSEEALRVHWCFSVSQLLKVGLLLPRHDHFKLIIYFNFFILLKFFFSNE